ncbi:hypothetical protein B0H13DRAFT_2419578 [Mycena leptocephala]|nr:hypothetical protein B0H13DRAFT_2419578 [Mycena leptocephala]
MYLAAANFYGQPVTTPFSAFDDPNGYAGSVPSVKCLKAMFTDFISANPPPGLSALPHRIFIERDIATLPLDAAKADHTFDVLKHTGRVKGERIFAALYTILNQFEEIRGHSLTFSKLLQFLKEMYDGILQGLIDSGNLPTQVLYTDSPQAERNFPESINSSLSKDAESVTDWTDCPPFLRTSNFPTINVSDPMVIEDLASEILAEVTAVTSPSQLSFVALAMKTDLQSDDRLHARTIQLRTKDKIYIFDIAAFTSPTNLLPSLRAIFTNPSIIKVGLSIRETLQTISEVLSVPELQDVLAAKNPPLLDLGKYAKLKGATNEPLSSLHALAASAAQNQQKQAETDGQLVTLVQGCKPVAEGCIIGRHIGYLDAVMDDAGHTKRINVSASRSLIQISKVLVPGAISSLHHQTMEWIFAHGKQAVVTTSQLHTRGMTPPSPANPLSRGFVAPTQLPIFDVEDEFHITYSVTHLSDSEEDSDDDSDPEEDEYGQLAFQVQLDPDLNEDSPDPRQGIEGEFQAAHNDTPMNPMVEGLQHAHTLLSAAVESEKLPSRVLDDAFHFMDRLLRLLSKKHSAFKAFSHDFSEAIFIRDKSDVLAVQAVLKQHGIDWDSSRLLLIDIPTRLQAWFRVSTPLRYNVVILRTTAQAEALVVVLKSNRECRLFIKNLRVEGGFGDAMHTILDVPGLSSGLPLISPQRVIVLEAVKPKRGEAKPRQNKQVTQLFETLLRLIPSLIAIPQTLDFPYIPRSEMYTNAKLDAPAEALASALAASLTLETLFVRGGFVFPEYLRRLGKRASIEFGSSEQHHIHVATGCAVAVAVTVFKTSEESFIARSFKESETLGKIKGSTLEVVDASLNDDPVGPRNNRVPVEVDPIILAPFTSLTRLESVFEQISFSKPPLGFSALSKSQELIVESRSPSVLDIGLPLPLTFLREVRLHDGANVPASTAFLQCNGAKLLRLNAPLDILIKINVFDLCTSLETLVVFPPYPHSQSPHKVIPENFIACSAPQTTLSRIRLDFNRAYRPSVPAIKALSEWLGPASFPVLKEIQIPCIKWPTSERELEKNVWIPLSEVLLPKGITLTDKDGPRAGHSG